MIDRSRVLLSREKIEKEDTTQMQFHDSFYNLNFMIADLCGKKDLSFVEIK